MTIAANIARNDYTGAGSVGPYAYNFKIFAATELDVIRRDTATGTETQLVYLSDYTVSGAGNASGGTVTLIAALASGQSLTIRQNQPLTQTTDIRNQGSYLPETIEDRLDKLTLAIQQHDEELGRTLKLARTRNPSTTDVEISLPTTAKALVGTGTGFTLSTLDAGAIAIPGNGRTVTTLSAYLANNAVANAKDFGAIGDGLADDTAALTLAFALPGAVVYLPAGTYLTGNLPQPACAGIVGAGAGVSILQAKSGATKILTLGGACTVHANYQVYGNTTASAYGIVFGDAESGAYLVSNVVVRYFTGANAVGVHWKNALKSRSIKLTVQRCSTNVLCDGTGGLGAFPTTLTFDSLACIDAGLSGSGGVGLKIVTADTLVFNEPMFDSNQAEAVRVQPAASGTVAGVVFKNPRFEGNQVGGAATFQMVVDGSAAGCTARVALYSPQWFSSTAKSLQITGAGCAGYVVDQPQPTAGAGSITIASGAFGTINLPANVLESAVSDSTGFSGGVARGKVRFPATQSASTDANTLDDYAEGTFTPTLTLGSGSVTYTTQTGTFTKIGRLVTLQIRIVVNVATTPSGTVTIGGFPFTASASPKGAFPVAASGLAATATHPMIGQPDFSAATARLYRPNGTGSLVDPGADIASGCYIQATVTYEV